MRYAIIEDGKVVNIAVSETALETNWIQSDTAKNGDSWDGSAFSLPAVVVADRKLTMIARCKADREAKTNTNETVAFPVDRHEIQTSNEIDIRNLLVKTTAAIAIAGAGGGSRNYSYTTAGKVRVTMTVQQFVNCALSIMAIKDQIFEDYETLRVSIENAADNDALDTIEKNWPT